MVMAQLASDGMIPYSCYQFYPTSTGRDGVFDRSIDSFTIILEKVDSAIPRDELRRSFLMALGDP
jgi:hypothetical protein